ncbi:MAG: cytochrome c3 family protein [Methylobacter sp.]|uniref:cytochrome c3 family protein n=1 Tax=Methylobacter sp. TaxID=2051955 RepID=UPI002730C549|nr:cytochrome c3 family protein [Methylobacter sp.]MDP1666718.1 cytochrome c3 family protein [Methylobacter sp.]
MKQLKKRSVGFESFDGARERLVERPTHERNRRVQRFMMVIGGCVLFSMSAVQAADNPHTIAAGKSGDCAGCHVARIHYDNVEALNTKNKRVDLNAFNNDGVAMCSGCHKTEDGHKVGLKLDFEIPADMPFNKKNALSCLTCHYTHGDLTSAKPQASFSFMDRLLNDDRLHKSFLLRRNNVDGELCLICHNSNQESK